MKRDIDGLVDGRDFLPPYECSMFDCACIIGCKNRLTEGIRGADGSPVERFPVASVLAGPVKPTRVETRCVLWAFLEL